MVVLTRLPAESVMVTLTWLFGGTSVVEPDRSMVWLPLSTLAMATVRSPVVASKLPVAESMTALPLRSCAEASTVRSPSTRLEMSTPVRL